MEHRGFRAFLTLSVLFVLFAASAAAQLPSAASLTGAYNVRYLGVQAYPCDCPTAFSGTFTFDGKGGFTVTGQGTYNNGTDHALTVASTGQYTVWSNGITSLSNPFAPANSGTSLFGGIGQGALIASSTDTDYLDIFVAVPAATSASNATLTGTYQVAGMEFGSGSFANTRNTFFTMTSDAAGNFGNVSVKGASVPLKDVNTTQTSTGVTYTVGANGTGTVTFPAPSGVATANQLLSGAKTLYVSQDGSLFIAGSPTGYDFEIGIKSATAAKSTLSGLYFAAELENYTPFGNPSIYAYQGAANEAGDAAGTERVHNRVNPDGDYSYDQVYNDSFTVNSSGISSGSGYQLAVSNNSNVFVVIGGGGDYFLFAAVRVPNVSGTGVFLSPYGVVNAASYAPFTAQISPGEMITLFGTGLAKGEESAAALPFQNTLGGVSVTVGGKPAPVFYVSATQVSAVVPYGLTDTALTVQLTNNGTASNPVNVYGGLTSPGVFTVPPGGIGGGAILHPNSPNLVNAASPAKVGETVQIFLTGLGEVKPTIAAGAAGSSDPNNLNKVVSIPDVYIDGLKATVAFAGLAPGLGALYQLNVTIPAGVSTGDVDLEISTVDADVIQATISIGK